MVMIPYSKQLQKIDDEEALKIKQRLKENIPENGIFGYGSAVRLHDMKQALKLELGSSVKAAITREAEAE